MTKKKNKNKIPSKVWKKYKIDSEKLTRARYCPRCGPSSFLGDHKDRYVCGHCKFVEIKKKQ